MPPLPASTLPPRPPILATRPPPPPFTRVIRITNVPQLATAWDLLAHFASTSPISASQTKDLLGGYTIAYMNFASKGDRASALRLQDKELWLMGRTLNVVAVSEGFSFQGDQVVALGEMNRNRMAMGSALRARETEGKQAVMVLDENAMQQTDSNELGTDAPDNDNSMEISFRDAMDESHE